MKLQIIIRDYMNKKCRLLLKNCFIDYIKITQGEIQLCQSTS